MRLRFLHSSFFIPALFILLCLINNLALPLFEASDEASHFRYADYLATEHHLPDLNKDLPSHEATQPVLYYALLAVVISPFDRSNLSEINKLNPDWFDKSLNADYKRVKNLHLHTPAEQWPWPGAVWAVHVARLLSSLLGAFVILLVFLMTRLIAPRSTLHAPLAAALVAFNPKFIHISSIVSNDIAITLAATAACWWMVRLAQRPAFIVYRRSIFVLGVLCGLAVLCKLSGIGVLAPVGVFFGIGFRQFVMGRKTLASASKSVLAFLIGFVLIAGGWFAFNTLSYGNPLAWAQVREANAALLRVPPLGFTEIIAAAPRVLESYWGVVGIELGFPRWVNIIFWCALGLAIIGCIKMRLEIRDWRLAKSPISNLQSPWIILITWHLALLALFVVWLRGYIGTENGRLIMPGVAPVAIAVAAGWLALVPHRWHRLVAFTSACALFGLALATPFWVIRPAFATPDYLSPQQITALPSQAGPTFGGDVKLLQAQINQRSVKPGEAVRVSLVWGATQTINQSYRVILEAIDLDGEVIGRTRAIPSNGRFATQHWPASQFFQDEYEIAIDADAKHGATSIKLSLFAQYPEEHLLKVDGTEVGVIEIGKVKIDSVAVMNHTAVQAIPVASFGKVIELNSMNLLNGLFTWRCLKRPDKDYTLFIHVIDKQGNLIWQSDAQPLGGRYPTRLWDANDVIEETRQINLNKANRVLIGWYDAQTGVRLPATKADGTRWPDDVVPIWPRDNSVSP